MASALVLLFSALFLSSVLFEVYGQDVLLNFPPRGWNSYDSFSWIIDEESFLDNAEIVSSRLLSFGYEYVVVDFLWYRKNVNGALVDSYGYDNIDEWGRLVPDPDRWPSSRFGKGFKEVARKVHDMGLKFGIHVMRGVSLQTFNSNKTILDVTTEDTEILHGSAKGLLHGEGCGDSTRRNQTKEYKTLRFSHKITMEISLLSLKKFSLHATTQRLPGLPYEEDGRIWQAGDIGMRNMPCSWMKHGFMSVNTDLGAGRAFLRSLYQQYADWDVDFVKLDCVFGDDLNKEEIVTVSEILEGLGRHVLFSLSPGTSVTPSMAESVRDYVDLYRITGDTWDRWDDITAHFDVARDFAAAKLIGVNGLHGNSWPDLDMLPLGWLTDPGVRKGPHRKCSLTLDEQRTLLTLWSIAKSPLMFGGDLRQLDDLTFTLITNPALLELNSYSRNNVEMRSLNDDGTLFSRYSDLRVTRKSLKANVNADGIRSWIATGRRGEIYLSFFNLNPTATTICANIGDLAKFLPKEFLTNRSCRCYDVWSGKNFGVVDKTLSIVIQNHGCALFLLNCKS